MTRFLEMADYSTGMEVKRITNSRFDHALYEEANSFSGAVEYLGITQARSGTKVWVRIVDHPNKKLIGVKAVMTIKTLAAIIDKSGIPVDKTVRGDFKWSNAGGYARLKLK